MKYFIRHIILSLTIITATSCYDEFVEEGIIGNGKASISATLDFKPMSSALSRTRAAGDALKDIGCLHVLLYDYETKELKKSWEIEGYTVSDEDRDNKDAENGTSAEVKTKRATFKLPERIGFGKYYMYAVANIPDLFENYSDAIQTVDGLKNIPLTWDSGNITANGQMIGCLTNAPTPSIDDEPIILNENSTNLHAWLRRAASKVTVAFDGSTLKEGVSIYIKSLRIKNIPASCSLGTNNTVSDTTNLIITGEEVIYSTSTSYDANHPTLITKDQPFYPRVRKPGDDGTWVMDPDAHSETNPNSLFFYENMQGDGPDKRQDKDNNGVLDELYKYKEKAYATYIEVDAYYESTDPERPNRSNIIYRIMLGQNITTNYDAKRNCHYKLTLHFNGYADEPDWRIDHVTRLLVTQPETVDYRGKYFVPDNKTSNQGNNFSDENVITVTSFMYQNDDWYDRKPLKYKIEYREADSCEFTKERPDWLDEFTTSDDKKGTYTLKIKYKNPYTEVDLNDKLKNNTAKSKIYDLSTKGGSERMNTANCYIVDSKGTYQFPLVYGNAITNGDEILTPYTYQGWGSGTNYLATFKNYKNEPISSPYILYDIYGSADKAPDLNASLVWQDEPNLVTDITYDKTAYGYGGIRFTVGTGIKEGNAVIALEDADSTIMWSWHIWVTAIDFTKKIILTNADAYGKRNFEIMPVNLGWCSGDIPIRYYDRHECEVRFTQYISDDGQEGISKTVKIVQEPHIALPMGNNPYFQWGRKDPFIAGGNANATTKPWYNAAGKMKQDSVLTLMHPDSNRIESNKVIADLIRNPHKWQNGPHQSPGDWGNPFKPKDSVYFNLWDNSCWDDNDDVVKTVYDPCPAGYHVSSIYTFSGFTDYGGSLTDGIDHVDIRERMYAATEENMLGEAEYKNGVFEFYTNKSKLISIGFPLNGYRDWDDYAIVRTFGTYGQIWHAQAAIWSGTTYASYHFEYNRYHHIWPWNNFYATDGFPVRPSKTLP